MTKIPFTGKKTGPHVVEPAEVKNSTPTKYIYVIYNTITGSYVDRIFTDERKAEQLCEEMNGPDYHP